MTIDADAIIRMCEDAFIRLQIEKGTVSPQSTEIHGEIYDIPPEDEDEHEHEEVF